MTILMRTSMSKRVKAPVAVASREVLSASDFTYLGKHPVDRLIGYNFGGGGELNFGQGFTLRYVGGQLRFLTYGFISGTMRLVEFAKPASLGDTITTATNVWTNITTPSQHHGITWDETDGVLWTTDAIDYPETVPQEQDTKTIATRVLNSNGTISSYRGLMGLQGINGRRVFGGMCRIPSWFRTAHSLPEFAVGFGGYTSRLGIGPVSLGPTMYAIPDPRDYSDGAEIPDTDFKVLMDHSSGSGSDDSGSPTTYDRGRRFNLDYDNEYDGGNWTSPASDLYGRFCWGDDCNNSACWIDNDAGTRTKHGFVLVPTLGTGRLWYEGSTLNYTGKTAEIQIFDPSQFAECAASTRNAWNVQPVAGKDLTSDLTGHLAGGNGFLIPGGVAGAAFDPTDSRLYVYANDSSADSNSTILVYSVGGA